MRTKLVVSRVDEILKPLGFSRQKAIWNRWSEPFVDVIDVQTSKIGDALTLNAGVLHMVVHKVCWATELPSVIKEPECTVRARVGQLIDNKDLWWQVSDGGTIDDVVEKLTFYVLPFVERMHSLQAMEEFLTPAGVKKQDYPLPVIYRAILKHEQGNNNDACALLTGLGGTSVGAWRTRISEVAERLGCS